MKRTLLPVILLLINSSAFPLAIHIAPIKYYVEENAKPAEVPVNFQELLTSNLQSQFQWEKISFKILDNTIEPPGSFIDAMRICTEYALDYLLYGFIEEKAFSLYGELKLFDSGKQEIIQAFYSSDNREHTVRLVDDLTGKIIQYLKDIFGLPTSTGEMQFPTEGILTFAAGGGYWIPLTVEWYTYMQALYSACFYIRFIPWRPAAGGGCRGIYFRTGLTGYFYHSINKSGYEGMNLYAFTFGIPVTLCLDIGMRHTISLGVEPQFAVDYLVRERLYADVIKTPSLLFSSAADMEYQFHLTNHFSMSVGNRVVLQFINPPRILYSVILLCEVNLNPITTGEKNHEK